MGSARKRGYRSMSRCFPQEVYSIQRNEHQHEFSLKSMKCSESNILCSWSSSPVPVLSTLLEPSSHFTQLKFLSIFSTAPFIYLPNLPLGSQLDLNLNLKMYWSCNSPSKIIHTLTILPESLITQLPSFSIFSKT